MGLGLGQAGGFGKPYLPYNPYQLTLLGNKGIQPLMRDSQTPFNVMLAGLPNTGKSLLGERFARGYPEGTFQMLNGRNLERSYQKTSSLKGGFWEHLEVMGKEAAQKGQHIIYEDLNLLRIDRQQALTALGAHVRGPWLLCLIYAVPSELGSIQYPSAYPSKRFRKNTMLYRSMDLPTLDEGFDHMMAVDMHGNELAWEDMRRDFQNRTGNR